MNRIFTIPNILSFLRILMIPFIVIAILQKQYVLAGILILVSFITDVSDGFIARRFNMISDLGKMLDPLADKLTQGSIGFSLCLKYPVIIPMVILLVVKELTMLFCGIFILKHTGKPFCSYWWGKVSTGTFYCAVFLICILNSVLPSALISIFSWITFATLLLSLIMYLRLYVRVFSNKEEFH